jgi:hypothetical protein
VRKLRNDDARDFHDGLAAVCVGGMCYPHGAMTGAWGFIDADGHDVVAPRWDWVADFAGGLAAVARWAEPRPEHRLDDPMVWGFVDQTGAVVVEPRFTAVEPFVRV